MAEKLPLVYVDGELSQLPPGDQAEGGELGNLIAGSGLVGGGDLQTGSKRLDVALAPNPSGLIFVGDTVGMDGADLVTADAALASGNAALVDVVPALASGVAGLADATTALASGNAALSDAVNFVGSSAVILTASSTIQAGNPVGLDDAGKASVITEVTSGDSRTYGSSVVFEAAESGDIQSVYDPSNDRVVIAYYDDGNSRYGTAVVGTVSGSSISFGTPVVFESASTGSISVTYDSSNNKVVISYSDVGNSEYGTAVVGTVSGTSISFGSPAVFNSNATYATGITYDSTNNKVVISYIDGGNSNYGTAVVGTVSGTSISFGSAVVFQASSISYPLGTYDSTNNKVVIVCRDNGNSGYGTAIVGTVSGTSISFGTAVVFNNSGDTTLAWPCFDSSNGKVVIAYSDDSSTGSAIVGTVSGTSISFGTEVEFESNSINYTQSVFDSTNNKVIVSYTVSATTYVTAIVGTVSGTSISFGSAVVVNAASSFFPASAYDSTNDRVVISYRDDGNSRYGTSKVGSPGTSTFPTLGGVNNFIGVANSTVASGDSVKVNAPRSVNHSNAGLSTGYFYYVDPSASGFTTTATQPSSWTAGDYSWGSVAKAVSSSGLLILDTI